MTRTRGSARGPGTATDGGPKFDLAKFDQAYFDRLRARVQALNAAGIYAGVYLFTGEWLAVFRCASDGYPFTAREQRQRHRRRRRAPARCR